MPARLLAGQHHAASPVCLVSMRDNTSVATVEVRGDTRLYQAHGDLAGVQRCLVRERTAALSRGARIVAERSGTVPPAATSPAQPYGWLLTIEPPPAPPRQVVDLATRRNGHEQHGPTGTDDL